MKTSIEISDPLLNRARALAAREGKTLRELVEAGLRLVLEREERAEPFKLRDASVGGRGLVQGLRYDEWGKILEVAYEGRTLTSCLRGARVSGPLIHDGRIAALCALHGIHEQWTADRDFSRFSNLRTRNPLV